MIRWIGVSLVAALVLCAVAIAINACPGGPCPAGENSERHEGVVYCVWPEDSLHPGVSR